LALGLLFALLSFTFPLSLYAGGLFGSDHEEVLWQSGINLYIKLVRQEGAGKGKTPPNDHPVILESGQITNALNMIEFWEKKGYTGEAGANRVFSVSQARLLGNFLSKGLANAKPNQDIVFALATTEKGLLGISPHKLYMAGRAFYHADRLHIIIGDYDRPPDKGLEAASGAAGVTEIQYFFAVGSRSRASDFKKTIVTGDGIEMQSAGNKRRRDWFVIEVASAATAYVARTEKKSKEGGVDSEAIRLEAARLAKERREMRAEMARIRKEMSESGATGLPSIEERLTALDELRDKNLISDAEYDRKRKEILDDI